jgi:MYXO-CTERM domain-containing protein
MLEIGISDSTRFLSGGSQYLGTQDEETSGIVDAWDTIGPGWWLINMQAHYGIAGELVEGGQLMAVFIPQTVPTPGAVAVLGLGGLMAARRRRSK